MQLTQKRDSATTPRALSVADAGKPLPSELVDLAVAELRFQTAFYLEAVEAMLDGVILGAEQVQDKRLEFLEKGPTVNPVAEILLFVITVILGGTIGLAIARLSTGFLLRPIMRLLGRAITTQQRRDPGELKGYLRLLLDLTPKGQSAAVPQAVDSSLRPIVTQLQQGADSVVRDLRNDTSEIARITGTLDAATTAIQVNLVAVAKGVVSLKQAPGSAKQLEGGDSPAVAIQAAAMESASRMRLSVIAMHEALEAELRRSGVTLGDAIQILSDSRTEGPVDLAQIRHAYQLGAEAMIWARLLLTPSVMDGLKRRQRLRSGAPGEVRTGDSSLLASLLTSLKLDAGTDPKCTTYLLKRFGDDIERWSSETNTPTFSDPLTGGSPRPTGWWGTLKPDDQEDQLVQYLGAVSDATPPELQLSS